MKKPTWSDSFELVAHWLLGGVLACILFYGICILIAILMFSPALKFGILIIIGVVVIPASLHQGYYYIKR